MAKPAYIFSRRDAQKTVAAEVTPVETKELGQAVAQELEVKDPENAEEVIKIHRKNRKSTEQEV